MKTPVLLCVAKPVMILGTPFYVLVFNAGVFAMTYLFIDSSLLSMGLFIGLQGLGWIKARTNPYFDRIWAAYWTRKILHSTKSILPSKGHRYAGR